MADKRRRTILFAIALAVIAGGVYAGALSNGFTSNYDDALYVTGNETVQQGLTLEGVAWAFTTGYAANWHPVTWLSHMLDVTLFGLHPAGHHGTNILFHVANTVLMFLALYRMTGHSWPSMATALFFAVHPLHVESVAWVAERKDVLSTFFWFLCLFLYPRYVEKRSAARYGGLLVCLALGLMAKPMVVTLPCTLLLFDLWPLKRLDLYAQDRWKQARALVLEKVPMFVLVIVSCIATFVAQSRGTAVSSLDTFPLWVRVANAFNGYGFYLYKTVLPTGLAAYYPHPGPNVSLAMASFWAVVIGIVSVCAILTIRKRPYIFVGWFWYLGTLVPVIGLVQVGNQAYADRYTYIPLVGLFILVFWGIYGWFAAKPYRATFQFVTAAAAGACILVTLAQVPYWQNDVTLFERTLAVTENNPLAHNNLATALMERGEWDRAEESLEAAVTINPGYADAYYNLGRIAEERQDNATALQYYIEAAAKAPTDPEPLINQAAVLVRMVAYDQAVSVAKQALELDPRSPLAYLNLGAAHAAANRPNDALAAYVHGTEVAPENAALHNNLANLLARFGQGEQRDKALYHFQQALRLEPGNVQARFNMAVLLDSMGRRDEATRELEAVVAAAPDFEAAAAYLQQRSAP